MRLLLIAASLLLPSAASADCALMGLEAKVLNREATVAEGGGLVVAAMPKVQGPLAPGDAALDTGWTWKSSKAQPTKVSLAPGLAVYQLAQVDQLVDAKQQRVANIKAVAKRDKLAAPKVKSITYEKPPHRRAVKRVVVELEAAPTGVVAMVLADANGKARSWGTVSGSTVEAFLSQDCLTLPNGTVETKPGDKVKVWFVDDAGRVSASTATLTVGTP